MSYDKESRKKRRSARHKAIAKQLVIYYQKSWVEGSLTPKRLGRMAKTAAMDCGRPNCGLCGNLRRIRGEITMAERRSLLTLSEAE